MVGTKKSGKTAVVEGLISELSRRGLRVGAIKHVHHEGFSLDEPGKDSWRFSKAGAVVCGIISPDETALIKKTETREAAVDELIDLFIDNGVDLILMEGFTAVVGGRPDIYKIVTAESVEQALEISRPLAGKVLALTGVLANSRGQESSLPILDIRTELALMADIVEALLARAR